MIISMSAPWANFSVFKFWILSIRILPTKGIFTFLTCTLTNRVLGTVAGLLVQLIHSNLIFMKGKYRGKLDVGFFKAILLRMTSDS